MEIPRSGQKDITAGKQCTSQGRPLQAQALALIAGPCSDTGLVSTEDQILSSELHGKALLTARRPELQPLIDHLREVAQAATTFA